MYFIEFGNTGDIPYNTRKTAQMKFILEGSGKATCMPKNYSFPLTSAVISTNFCKAFFSLSTNDCFTIHAQGTNVCPKGSVLAAFACSGQTSVTAV